LEESFVLKINPERPVAFPLYLRIPRWARQVKIIPAGGAVERRGNDMVITKTWNTGDVVKINFTAEIEQKLASNGEYYFKRGALLYALPMNAQSKILTLRNYRLPGFHDIEYTAADGERARWNFRVKRGMLNRFEYRRNDSNLSYPWDIPQVHIEGPLVTEQGEMQLVKLVPLGNTVLRRLTFPASP
ncbi:MAG TPA: hypothetical protein VEO56_04480, partial [Bacteroidota bacterium]|nr:hypothetical protein [Bacteroidota bacterium]